MRGWLSRVGIPSGGPAFVVGYEGTQRETDWQIVTLLNELAANRPLGLHMLRNADATPLWNALTEFAVPTGDLPAFEVERKSVDGFNSGVAAHETNTKVADLDERRFGHSLGRRDRASLAHVGDRAQWTGAAGARLWPDPG